MIKINLVPHEILAHERQRQRVLQLGVVASASVFLVFGISAWHYRQGVKAAAVLAATDKEYKEKWADIGAKLDKRKADVEALKTRLGVITDLLKGRAMYPHFMADVGRTMPNDAWVTAISTTRDAGKNQLKVTLTAMTASAPSISRWIRTLQNPVVFGTFSDPNISPINVSDNLETSGKQYAFTMTMSYTPKL